MMGAVFTETVIPSPIVRAEVLRYAGARAEDEILKAHLDACIKETEGVFTYRVSYGAFPLSVLNDTVRLGSAEVRSSLLAKNLSGCEGALVFAATVGIGLDRLIARAAVSPIRALLFDAVGSERIEALCDAFCAEQAARYAKEGRTLRQRFSPGYGDLPLDFQRAVFSLLDPAKHIGLTLNESLLMSPSKSVTAIVGITTQQTQGAYL